MDTQKVLASEMEMVTKWLYCNRMLIESDWLQLVAWEVVAVITTVLVTNGTFDVCSHVNYFNISWWNGPAALSFNNHQNLI